MGDSEQDIFEVLDVVFPDGRGLVAMLVFTDLGKKSLDLANADSEDNVICVSAVIFKRQKYKQFTRAWNQMLSRWGASAFRAADFYPGGGEFKRNTPERERLFAQDCRRIPRMVGSKIEKVTLLAFRPKEYISAAPAGWLRLFGDSVHSMAMQIILIEHGWWREDHHPGYKFSYFMETGDEDEGKVQETVRGMRNDPTTSKVIAVKSFARVDKGDARGLEAADFWAWHWNKYYVDKVLKGLSGKPREDFKATVGASNNKVDEFLITGKKLKYFFSRVPEDVLAKGRV